MKKISTIKLSAAKLPTIQVILLSTGGMIGAGWLFSPYYGFHTAGAWVVLSWIIVAIMTFVIALSFAEVSTILPIVGGISRFMGITHNKAVSFVFLLLGWLSYVVYLPLEVQSCIQYLGYWFSGLVVNHTTGSTLSYYGLGFAFLIMVLLTQFNTLFLSRVSRANSIISIWKIIIPLLVAWILIIGFGNWHNVNTLMTNHKFSFEDVLLAITASGLAFAFSGFQNGLILANSVANPKKTLPYSLFSPIIFGFILYCSLSLAFIFCVGDTDFAVGSSAPLLGLVALFSIHIIFTILFIDAVISPLGTANVYTAITARILLSLARDFLPNSIFVRLNKNLSPAHCLWFNLLVGACFLLPFPTWQQLVDFLSSMVVFAYLSGPITLIILRKEMPDVPRVFKVSGYKFIGYLGFICCSLLIYWSGLNNLIYLFIAVIVIILLYGLLVNKDIGVIRAFRDNAFIMGYLLLMVLISYMRQLDIIMFPLDNICVIVTAFFACKVFIAYKVSSIAINDNIIRYNQELNNGEASS
ncbi:MAG: APC family permease [Proteobacteria bacterium]|jgi:amino acid transporter|nr:APC family permease [Pseudomonadota bacterium]